MTLRFECSRQLNAEIESVAGKLGVRFTEPDQMAVDGENMTATVRKCPIPGSRRVEFNSHMEDVCNMKNCYCRAMGDTKRSPRKERPTVAVDTRLDKTWQEILGGHMDHLPPPPRNLRNQSCQVGGSRPERPTSLGNGQELPPNWCHPHCLVNKLSHQAPGDLLSLKAEVDKAVDKMGLDDCLPLNGRSRRQDPNRNRVVFEYLEDLSTEMLKRRLDETETKYKSMKTKLEEAMVAQKLEIQSLQRELSLKNEELTRLSKYKQKADLVPNELMQRERDFIQRIRSLDDRMKAMMDRDERALSEVEKYKQMVSELKGELSRAEHDRDLFKAKMEIYQTERDKAVASLSVYEKTFRNLKNELGHEIQGIKPSLDLTADSCGTLDFLEPRGLATSSPNVSTSLGGSRTPAREPVAKRRTKHTLVGSGFESTAPKENVGEALIKKLEGLGKEFKQFSEKMVIPMAMGLDVEAAQLLDVSASTGLSWTDIDSPTARSSLSRQSS